MPLYEYRCNECNSEFDTLVRTPAAADDVTCRTCESANVHRLVSGFATVGGYDDEYVSRSSSPSGGCCGGSCGCGH